VVAPDTVAAIPNDALPDHITPFDLAIDPPTWRERERVRVNYSNYPCHVPVSAGMALCRKSNTHSSHPASA
jgi:hypothetical protein